MDALDDYMVAAVGELERRRKEIDEAILALKKVMAQTNQNLANEMRQRFPWANPGPRLVKFFCNGCEREVYANALRKNCPACGDKKLTRQ